MTDQTGKQPTPKEVSITPKRKDIILQGGELVKDYNEAAALGRNIFRIAVDRQERRFGQYLNPEGFDKEDLLNIIEKGSEQSVVTEDVRRARRSSFSIAVEAAAQINEARLPQTAVREDSESMEAIMQNLRQARSLYEVLEKDDPEAISLALSKATGKRHQPVEKLIDQAKMQIAKETIERAFQRINRGYQILFR